MVAVLGGVPDRLARWAHYEYSECRLSASNLDIKRYAKIPQKHFDGIFDFWICVAKNARRRVPAEFERIRVWIEKMHTFAK